MKGHGLITGRVFFKDLIQLPNDQKKEKKVAIIHPDGDQTIFSRAHWAEISIQQGAGKYCLIAIRMYDCDFFFLFFLVVGQLYQILKKYPGLYSRL